MKNRSYRVTVRQSDDRDDGLFAGTVAEFPDIKEYGETEEEVMTLIADAVHTSTVVMGITPPPVYVRHYDFIVQDAPDASREVSSD